jgi:nitrogen regulatory protein P-II 1
MKHGIEFFSFWEARGVGMARESRVYRGIAYDTSTIERLYLQIIVRDVNLEKTIDTIIKIRWLPGKWEMERYSSLPWMKASGSGPVREGDESLYIKD